MDEDTAPLGERVDELAGRVRQVLGDLDLRERIAANPWAAIGIAAAAGAWLGTVELRRASGRGSIRQVVLAGVGAITMRLVREAALREVMSVAIRWWNQSTGAEPRDTGMRHEVRHYYPAPP